MCLRRSPRAPTKDSSTRSPLLQLRSSLMNAATVADVNALYAPYRSERVTARSWRAPLDSTPSSRDLLEVPLADAYAIAAATSPPTRRLPRPARTERRHYPSAQPRRPLEGARAILIDRALTDPVLGEKLLTRLREGGVIGVPRDCRSGKSRREVLRLFRLLGPYSLYPAAPRAGAAPRQRRRRGAPEGGCGPAPWRLAVCAVAARAEAEAAAENYENVRSAYEREVAAALRIPVQVLNTVDDEDRVLGWIAATVRTAWRSHLRPRLAERIRHRLLDTAAQNATEVFASNLRDILLARARRAPPHPRPGPRPAPRREVRRRRRNG